MISRITGQIIDHSSKFLIVEVNGLAFKVFCPEDTLNRSLRAEKVSLFTHLSVKENSFELYGFIGKESLEFFEMLISISGIGPKSAIGILNIAPVETIKNAILSGDTASLVKISGIGKKTAEKISLELKEKLQKGQGAENGYGLKEEADAIEALKALGYSQKESREALKDIDANLTASEKIKQALKMLSSDKL